MHHSSDCSLAQAITPVARSQYATLLAGQSTLDSPSLGLYQCSDLDSLAVSIINLHDGSFGSEYSH